MKYAMAQIVTMCIATYLAVAGSILLALGNHSITAIMVDYFYEDELAYRQYMQAAAMQKWGVALLIIAGLFATAAIASAWYERISWKRALRHHPAAPVQDDDLVEW